MYHGSQHNVTGSCIHALRVKRYNSQIQLAMKVQTLDVSLEQDAISRIENGQRIITDYELHALAKVLAVSINELFSISP